MCKLLAFFVLFVISMLVSSQADNMLGPGIWSLISISKCPNEDEMEEIKVVLEVEKHKLNRTHAGISSNMSIIEELNDNFAVYVEICKYVDGGCKQYQILSDDSVARFLKKYSKANVEAALRMAKLDPPDFPIPKGDYQVNFFIMDYCALPRNSVYGKFDAYAYLLKEKKKVACVKLVVEFNKFEEENFCDE